MPLRPQCDAMASIRSAMRSKSGPSVSERTYFSRRLHPCPVSGSGTNTSARILRDVAAALVEELVGGATWVEST